MYSSKLHYICVTSISVLEYISKQQAFKSNLYNLNEGWTKSNPQAHNPFWISPQYYLKIEQVWPAIKKEN